MKRRDIFLLVLGLVLTGLASAAGVGVQLRLVQDDALELAYSLPESCMALPFEKDGADGKKIRASWQPLDDCGSIDNNVLRRTRSECKVLRFRVPATINKVSGYPAAFPMGHAIYAHTSNYALGTECGPLSYAFSAAGSIALNGRVAWQEATLSGAQANDVPVLLLQDKLADNQGLIGYFDPRLSTAAVAQIKTVAEGTAAFLQKALPDAVFRRPILAAALASAPGGPNVGGDGGDVMRLAFFNWPNQPTAREQQLMTLLVAHEMSHRFQLRDAVDRYPNARLIHEGGAEFLRWMVSVKQGWLSHEQAAANLDEALANCMIAVADQSWGQLSQRFVSGNGLEYQCGLPVYVYALAARQGTGSALDRFNHFYRELKDGKQPDFAQILECNGLDNCQAHWLPRLLGQDGGMDLQWERLFGQTGLARSRPASQSQRDAMMVKAIGKLMEADCAGRKSVFVTPDGLLLDAIDTCKTFRTSFDVRQVEGKPLFGDGQALSAMNAACRLRHSVMLGLKNGDQVAVACAAPYGVRDQFFSVDIEKVLSSVFSAGSANAGGDKVIGLMQ